MISASRVEHLLFGCHVLHHLVAQGYSASYLYSSQSPHKIAQHCWSGWDLQEMGTYTELGVRGGDSY